MFFTSFIGENQETHNGWCYKFLSMADHLTLIKNVLCSIPLHILTVLKVPVHITHDTDRLLRDFLWGYM